MVDFKVGDIVFFKVEEKDVNFELLNIPNPPLQGLARVERVLKEVCSLILMNGLRWYVPHSKITKVREYEFLTKLKQLCD